MTTQTTSPLGKGQLRCFQCRQAVSMKDGSWQTRQNQQVFLCRICAKPAAAKGKFSG